MIKQDASRDALLTDFGRTTLEDRYLMPGETYQGMFARVATAYSDDAEHAGRMYDYMSKLWFMPATPVLSNGGAGRGLPISCFLNVVGDSLDDIRGTWNENIDLAANGGGIGTYWGGVRSIGEKIKGSGSTSGIIPFVKVMDSLTLAISQGSLRRGSAAVYLDVFHPEVEEFLEIRKPSGDANRKALNLHHGINITDEFMEAVRAGASFPLRSPKTNETVKFVDARGLWQKILETRLQTGEPYLLFVDTANRALPDYQKDQGLKVLQSNLCVAPETLILTDQGHLPIASLEGQRVHVWNGSEFSNVEILKTGENQPLIQVTMSDGAVLDCTPYHKFYVVDSYGSEPRCVRAGELTKGMKLIKLETPVLEHNTEWLDAYYHGFFCGDGSHDHNGNQLIYFYNDKKHLVEGLEEVYGNAVRINYNSGGDRHIARMGKNTTRPKFEVPHNTSVKTRLSWLAGLIDSDGCSTINGETQSVQISNTNLPFLNEIRMLLQTLGIQSKVRGMLPARRVLMPDGRGGSKEYSCKASYRLMFGEAGVQQLLTLGLNLRRVVLNKRTPQRDAAQFVKVQKVEDHGRLSDTYCFEEPLKHLGVFNGVLTGQCAEIHLPTNLERTAVCCLSSPNAEYFLEWSREPLFIEDVCRFLDNVLQDFIDRAPPSMAKAIFSAQQERAIGVGLMGFHSFLQKMGLPFGSPMAKVWNKKMFQHIRTGTDVASRKLALEKGPCPDADRMGRMERFSHKMAVAPTASISIICGGTSAGIEPIPANIYTHKTKSGSFIVKNPYLVDHLQELGLNTPKIWDSILENGGSVAHLAELSDDSKAIFATAFEIDQRWVVELANDRAPMICQGQSVNLFLPANVDKWDLHMLHWQAWEGGSKSLYYLRSKSIQRAAHAGSATNYEECLACQ